MSTEKRGAPMTQLELAIASKLNQLARAEAPPEKDARAVAMLVVRHWGDEAPRVMQLALEFARDEVGRWAPSTSSAPADPPRQKPAPSGSRRRKRG